MFCFALGVLINSFVFATPPPMCGFSVYFLKKTMDEVLRSLLLSGAFSAKLENTALSTPMCIPGVVKGKRDAKPTPTVPAWGKAGASLFFCMNPGGDLGPGNPGSPGSPEWEGNSRQVPVKQDTHFRAGLYSGVKYVLQPRILSASYEDSSYSHELITLMLKLY